MINQADLLLFVNSSFFIADSPKDEGDHGKPGNVL